MTRSDPTSGPVGVLPTGDEASARLVRNHFWFRSRNKLVIWALDTYCHDASSLLDVGCGTGFVLQAIRDWSSEIELLGSDLSAEALEIARELVPTATFIQRDAQHLESGKQFDVVCAFDVLEHLDDDEGALVGIAAVSRPGGKVLVNVPQYPWLWSAADDYLEHRRRYTRGEIETKMRSAGLIVERSFAWVGPLLPVIVASRVFERHSKGYDPTREFHLPAVVNRTFEAILGLERRMIQRGLSFPWGSSRFVVAAKARLVE